MLKKNIYIIKDGSTFWKKIEWLLTNVNAKIFTFNEQSAPDIKFDPKPDLVIAAEPVYKRISFLFQNYPRLIIQDSDSFNPTIHESKDKEYGIASWPVEDGAFLELTSSMLNLPERKVFRTLIRIFPFGKETFYIGQSENFSLTGIAFKSEANLNHGDGVTISFHVPVISANLKLDAKVVREYYIKDSDATFYGARFIDVDDKDKDILFKFVLS